MNTANRKTTGLFMPIIAVLCVFTLIAACSKEAENAAQAVDEATDSAGRTSRSFAVSAGADQTITLPTNSVTLRATVTAGTARTFRWSQETGATATISSPNSSSTNVTALTAGEYRFRLQATDSRGRSATDTVHVSVKGTGTANATPTVNAGTDQSITLPVSTATLTGTATDRDGTIASWAWSQASGPAATIQSPSSATTAISGMTTAGTYVFTLKVTDNGGATASANTTVTVKSASASGGATGNYGTLLYSTGYNSTSDIINGSGQHGNGGLSTTVYKDGPGSFKSVPANVSSGIRSEVQYSESLTPLEGAIEYDVMYEKLFQNSGHSLQFHPVTSGGSASPGLWHVDGKFWLVNWKGGSNAYYPTTFTIPTNKWLHMVFQYKIGSAGYMKLTIDGVVVFDKTNIQVGDGSGQYLKVGVNMWQNQESVVYYDNLKIWKK
ncbi:PKD domain-containing protein [Terrimonas ferruginea]|uniref:PKD domain-containing protein n=1 Tax=Terrimonas ferruginea TaxID=249 RepID=UPI000400F330|nr:hypothetical protein [Terrimonas ferruginea]